MTLGIEMGRPIDARIRTIIVKEMQLGTGLGTELGSLPKLKKKKKKRASSLY